MSVTDGFSASRLDDEETQELMHDLEAVHSRRPRNSRIWKPVLLLTVLLGLGLAFLRPLSSGSRAPSHDAGIAALGFDETECAGDGEQCGSSKSCCNSTLTCYEKNQFWSSCRSGCSTEVPDETDGMTWSCNTIGKAGSSSDAGNEDEDGKGEPSQPACTDVLDKACLKENCSIADGGAKGDCRETHCCSMPGTQCYKQNEYWASCKPSCDPDGATEMLGKGWSCKELGPRTPGDSHAWRPCAAGDRTYPLLGEADTAQAWDTAEVRAQELLGTLELDDKVALLVGQNDPYPNDRHGYAGYINPNFYFRNKCAMPLMLNDGPQGYNHYQAKLAGTTTQFPALLAVAASFDPEISRRYAEAISEEFVAKGANVMLGPDIEVGRNTLSGRAFETLSGEDPFLGSQLVRPFVQETLKKGIIVTVKHWLDNNEEDYRMSMNVNVSDRAQHEIYMPVFKAAIEAGAGAVMCSYQKVGGVHACENKHILQKLLREDLGFRGFVMSDWEATHDAKRSAESGLDMEMPGGEKGKFNALARLVNQGVIAEATVDKMAGHVLASMYAAGLFDRRFNFTSGEAALDTNVTSDAHREVALNTIIEGAVLLKNKHNVLPLKAAGKTVAMIGKYCKDTHDKTYGQGDVFSGGGSGYVMSNLQVTPLEGARALFTDAEVVWGANASAAEGADVAIVCASAHAEEGWDRGSLKLPEAADLVSELRAQAPHQKVIVLAVAPGAITTEWLEEADAALLLFMPGEQVGTAAAQLLTGTASPAGRLPVSLPFEGEKRFTPEQYPGTPFNDVNMTAQWSEGVLVGYRWNDAKQIPSAFSFGFGLTYTEFRMYDFQAICSGSGATVSLKAYNAGDRRGAVVPQLYVGFAGLRPMLRQLRGFAKVHLDPGTEATVEYSLTDADWSTWSEAKQAWVSALRQGETITVSVGWSSTDLAWSQDLSCTPVDEVRVAQ